MIAVADILDAQLHQIARAQLAVNGKIKQRQFANMMGQLQANPDRPDFIQPQGRLLANKFSLVPRRARFDIFGLRVHEILPIREWTFSLRSASVT